MMPSKVIWTCPSCGNREEKPGDDTIDAWGCPNCGTWMRRRFVYPPRTSSHRINVTRAGKGIMEINVVPRETR